MRGVAARRDSRAGERVEVVRPARETASGREISLSIGEKGGSVRRVAVEVVAATHEADIISVRFHPFCSYVFCAVLSTAKPFSPWKPCSTCPLGMKLIARGFTYAAA